MKRRSILVVFLVLCTLALSAWGADAQPRDATPYRAGAKVADPRVGLASRSHGDADNLLCVSNGQLLGTVRPSQRFRLSSRYEAVFFSVAAGGSAKFEMEVYLVNEDGTEDFLGADQIEILGVGPERRVGSLNVNVTLSEPGEHRLRIVSRSTADPVASDPVIDEDEVVVRIRVRAGTITPTPTPPPTAVTATPMPPVEIQETAVDRRTLGQGLSQTPRPTPTVTDAIPIPTDRLLQIASPRGHFLSSGVAAVENFDRGHGQTLVIREGQSIKFRSAYEFVWFHGTGGTAETALTVRLESAENKAPLASDEGTFPGDGSSYRIAGTLQTEVPFDEAGTYAVLATVRTRVDLNGSNEDEDTVRVRVLVIGEPEVGAIGGCVTSDADDTPLARVAMRIYGLDNRLYKVVYTGDDGTYKASGLQPGRYLVKADPLSQNYLAEWYDDAPTREEADPVTVMAGETTEEIDLALTPGGVIAGSVIEDSESNPGAITPLANVIVTAGSFETDEVMARTRTLEDGSYRLEKLPAGTYWVHAGNEAQSLIGEYYDDHLLREDADPVEVAEGGVVKRINFALQYGGGIAGRVIGVSTDDQLVPFKVTAYDWESNEAVRTVGVGPGGRYRIPSLPVGGYRVYAFDEAGRYIPEYYDEVTDPDEATKVVVKRGATALGIDFVLRPVGTPTVAVRPEVTHVKPGDTFSIIIGAEGVMDLGGYESDLSFNPQVIHAETVVDGGFLGSTGRKVVVMEPDIDNVNGLVSFGAVSTGDVPGPNGAGPLAIITFEAIASGDSELRLQGVQLTDTDGNPITCRTRNGKVVVAECIFGDFDCDCDVDIYDIMQVATRWGSEEGDPDYDPTYDVDDDGDIDIVDVAMVAAAWGNTCTDEAPGGALSAQGGDRALKRPKMLSTGLRLVPSPANGQVSQPLELEVVIDEAVDLGGFEFALQYDAARLSVDEEDVALGEFLGSTGRAPMPMEPQVTVDGGVGTVSFGAMTLGTTPPGPNGSGTLATITFTPMLAGEAGVSFANGQVTDTTGQPGESLALQGATLQIEATGDAFMPLVKKPTRGNGRAPRK